jgi:hypothetical protein
VACHEGTDALAALTYLVVALGLISEDAKSSQIARAAMDDNDLACMSLSDMARPTTSTIEFLRTARGTTENAIGQALAYGIDRQEAARFLRLIIRARERERFVTRGLRCCRLCRKNRSAHSVASRLSLPETPSG